MVSHPAAPEQDLSCVRLATSAGEALPVDLYRRWKQTFGVELLDGLGTAEMWHIFISNRPGHVRPGTLGTVVPGFEVKVCDDAGRELPDGDVGALWVRGASRALGYWQQMEKTKQGLLCEWYVSGDVVQAVVRDRPEPYKSPREVTLLEVLPRPHLGKVDRARLRKSTARFEPL